MKEPQWTLIEPYAGGASLSLHLCGATRAILPYQGSKWKYRHELTQIIEELGIRARDSSPNLMLNEPGPWFYALWAILKEGIVDTIDVLEELEIVDPKFVFDGLHNQLAASLTPERAAEFLFLQRLSFSGKAVGLDDSNHWKSPGFNTSSAYGKASTDRFGQIRPMIPSLIRNLRRLENLCEVTAGAKICRMQAELFVKAWLRDTRSAENRRAVVYLDPPYQNTTGYPWPEVPRAEVVRQAEAFFAHGASVMVSEAEPILELRGWKTKKISEKKSDESPFKSKSEEWVTYRKQQ